MMDLVFSDEAQTKLASKMTDDDALLLDLDDGIGPLSPYLKENGLMYQLFICPKTKVPSSFTKHFQTSLGPVYFTDVTEVYLDEHMKITYKPVQNRFELQSDQQIMESSLDLVNLNEQKNF
ncbi:MAG: iron-sulfur cluster biosynthesis family protein [Furfurilactobacillus sp.]|jgi:uncharacterized protein YqkB|nr:MULTISPECIES: iron-sulfur cluster biosynthesis family protein [Furfurilactobacillus]MCF6418253.1 iron-sulfur cluster biosynthesis family protein [Furfurilactobacillus milii]MCH4011774.1 iron-sulfur cluster biosynthesis family protein [Furfurilactobacillus sp.]MCH4037666.1 iron-sulfur cluster biosynthesis family protein [Furfurilactobacillus sp.]MCH4115698.1 iron-sulfur cluster biosynthesis family protein [Furfurilactobacillus sp.]MCI1339688.1 iron-sulfur cluster biosynthesis family protein 